MAIDFLFPSPPLQFSRTLFPSQTLPSTDSLAGTFLIAGTKLLLLPYN